MARRRRNRSRRRKHRTGGGSSSSSSSDEGEYDEEEGECRGDGFQDDDDDKEMLFLIEFLVDTLLLKPENMNVRHMDPCLLQGQTCIVLTFLHYPPMTLCELDMDPCRQTGGNCIKYNAGKSLMFALSESQFENPPPLYLEVGAYKMLPHGSVPDKLPVGVTKICVTELFKQVFEKVDEKPDKLPLSKSIKDKYTLLGPENKCPTGEITIYVRLSCLGQNVVTEFQRGGDDCEPFLFKNRESQKVYECKPKELDEGGDGENLCPPLPGWGTAAGKDCGGGGGGGGQEHCGQKPRGGQCQSDGNGGNEAGEDEEYEEFGAEVHGHALTIKVQKSQKKRDSGGSDTANQVTFQVPQSQNLCTKGKESNKANVYNIGPGGVQAVDGKGCPGSDPLQIVQGVDSPDKDVFVIRIGKKGEAPGKGKLELELRTPKVKIERNLEGPRKADKTAQTEKEEQPKKGKKRK